MDPSSSGSLGIAIFKAVEMASLYQTWGAKVHPSTSNLTGLGQKIFKMEPSSSGSLGIAIFKAVEMASLYEDTWLDQVLNILYVISGKVMRDFKGSANEFAIGGSGSSPVFRWGGGIEDKYFARMGTNVISVYKTETFSLIDKKDIKVENVMDLCWSPTDPVFTLYVPELNGENQPARVCLFQIPGKEELRQKNLFSVSDCKMDWQSNGEYLAVKVDRYTKTKKSTYNGFELFRIKKRDIPIEVFELDNNMTRLLHFLKSQKGQRFVIIHGDNPWPDVLGVSVLSFKCDKVLQEVSTSRFWFKEDLTSGIRAARAI
ncbi:eukaryotic translation initiation factor 3 subunit B-like protein [Tanacetum coccineum]